MKRFFGITVLVVWVLLGTVTCLADCISSLGSFGSFRYSKEIWPKKDSPADGQIIGIISIDLDSCCGNVVPGQMVYVTKQSQVTIETEACVGVASYLEKILYEGPWGVKAEEILRGRTVTVILGIKSVGKGEGQKDILIKGYFLISKYTHK